MSDSDNDESIASPPRPQIDTSVFDKFKKTYIEYENSCVINSNEQVEGNIIFEDQQTQPINTKTMTLINGFNNEIEKKLHGQQIPTCINYLCFKYYYQVIKVDSKIITEDEKDIFAKLLQKNNISIGYKWTLLFRGSEKQFANRVFNNTCTNMSNVICIIHSENGNVFGGFTSKGYPKFNGQPILCTPHHTDYNSFLYTLRLCNTNTNEPEIFRVDTNSWGNAHIYTACDSWGFGFCGHDIKVMDRCNEHNQNKVGKHNFKTRSEHCLNGGVVNFRIVEVEVYQCKYN
eukprot:247891_1